MRDIYRIMLILSAVSMCDASHAFSLFKSKEEKQRIKEEKDRKAKEALEKKAEQKRLEQEKNDTTLFIPQTEDVWAHRYSEREYVDKEKKHQFINLNWECKTTKMENGVFDKCKNLKTVVIKSNTLENIGVSAFSECPNLEGIDLSGCKNLKSIDDKAFLQCSSLKVIKLPDSVQSIGSQAFWNCAALENINLKKIESIGLEAFSGCTVLNNIDLSKCDKLTQIAQGAFYKCKALTNILFNKSLIMIENTAFAGCESLQKLDLKNVKYIKDSAFSGCSKLTTIGKELTVSVIGNDAFSGCSSLNIEHIPAESIGNNAFSGCSSISSVTIDKAKSLGTNVFEECRGLTSVYLQNSMVENIPAYAFEKCLKLRVVLLPFSVKSISECAFIWCQEIQSIDLHKLEKIGNQAFYKCTSLGIIKLPETLTYIGDNAFTGCENLTINSWPKDLATIGKEAFKGSGITDINFSIYPYNLGVACFEACQKLKKVYLSAISRIPNALFKNCTALEDVYQLYTNTPVTDIGESAFDGCTNLKKFQATFDKNITIEKRSFADCENLEGIDEKNVLGFKPKSIGDEAFKGCNKLKKLDISAATSIGHEVFNGCDNLTSFGAKGSFPQVAEVGKEMFAECSIKHVEMPDKVTKIHDGAFRDCTSLTSSIISNNVTSIGAEAYSGCKNLESILLPVKLEFIGDEAFNECKKLKSITIPSSVENIGSQAFYGCTGIEQVTCSAKNYKIVIDAIDCIHGSVNVVNIIGWQSNKENNLDDALWMNSLEKEKLHMYKGDLYPIDVEELKVNMLSAASDFKTIRLKGDNLKKIGPMAFYGMANLESIEFPKNVENIDKNAFKGCDKLSEIIVPEAAYNAKNKAFDGFKSVGTRHLIHKKIVLKKV